MEVAAVGLLAQRAVVVARCEGKGKGLRLQHNLVGVFVEHFLCDVGLLLATLQSELLSLHDLVVLAGATRESERSEPHQVHHLATNELLALRAAGSNLGDGTAVLLQLLQLILQRQDSPAQST